LHELLLDDVGEPVDLEDLVVILRLIQSHGQGWAASPALVEKDADGGGLFAFEILGNLGRCGRGDFNHGDPP
jgi:hypothetical protein